MKTSVSAISLCVLSGEIPQLMLKSCCICTPVDVERAAQPLDLYFCLDCFLTLFFLAFQMQ